MPDSKSTRFICVTGLPGSGKSYFAIRLAQALGAKHLNSDRIRTKLGLRGSYDLESKKLVYDQLLLETKNELEKGKSVVLDSTFYQANVRQPFMELGESLGAPIFWIEVHAKEEVIKDRIAKQRPYSQADFQVYQSIRDRYEALDRIDLKLASDQFSPDEMIEQTKTSLGMMTSAGVRDILTRKALPDSVSNPGFIETHASWILLSDNYAFKVKKPVHFSFMDFSTLARRKHFCYREIELNRRLTSGMYLEVIPIRKGEKGPYIGESDDEIIDYSVQLKRMDESLRMENLLHSGGIETTGIERIAHQLATFHQNAEIIRKTWDISTAQLDFYDLKKVRPFIAKQFGRKKTELFDRILLRANQFLTRMGSRFVERAEAGFIRDGHGDLHSGNIFMYPEPILFDCIEFNDHFRQLDLLDELAFLCMDLEFHGFPDLASHLIDSYEQYFRVRTDPDDQLIFNYFKMYRANVRLKVTVLKDQENPSAEDLVRIQSYLELLDNYSNLLK